MRIRPKRVRACAVLLALLAPALVASQTDQNSVIYFKNGRALRVLDYREDGDWVYLVLSEPKKPEAKAKVSREAEPEDLVRELGVLAASIDRIEDARTGRGGPTVVNPISGAANGLARSPSEYDRTSAARLYLSRTNQSPSPDETAARRATNTEKRANTPAAGSPEAAALNNSPGQWEVEDFDVSKSMAGAVMREPLNNLKVPRHILDRARVLIEQRRLERERRQAGAAGQAPESGGGSGSDR